MSASGQWGSIPPRTPSTAGRTKAVRAPVPTQREARPPHRAEARRSAVQSGLPTINPTRNARGGEVTEHVERIGEAPVPDRNDRLAVDLEGGAFDREVSRYRRHGVRGRDEGAVPPKDVGHVTVHRIPDRLGFLEPDLRHAAHVRLVLPGRSGEERPVLGRHRHGVRVARERAIMGGAGLEHTVGPGNGHLLDDRSRFAQCRDSGLGVPCGVRNHRPCLLCAALPLLLHAPPPRATALGGAGLRARRACSGLRERDRARDARASASSSRWPRAACIRRPGAVERFREEDTRRRGEVTIILAEAPRPPKTGRRRRLGSRSATRRAIRRTSPKHARTLHAPHPVTSP